MRLKKQVEDAESVLGKASAGSFFDVLIAMGWDGMLTLE